MYTTAFKQKSLWVRCIWPERLRVPIVATPRALFPPNNHPPPLPSLIHPSLHTLPQGSSWKPNMQILLVQTGWGSDIQITTLAFVLALLAPYVTHDRHIVSSGGTGFHFRRRDGSTPPPRLLSPSNTLPHCLSLPWFFPLITEGCWNITGLIRHPPKNPLHSQIPT